MVNRVRITPREYEVVQWLCEGLHCAEIGKRTGLTTSTVRTYLKRVNKMVGTHSQLELAVAILKGRVVVYARDQDEANDRN